VAYEGMALFLCVCVRVCWLFSLGPGHSYQSAKACLPWEVHYSKQRPNMVA